LIRAVVIEDEGVAARRLAKMLIAEGVEIMQTLESNSQLEAYLRDGGQPDLFFMDIHLNDGVVFETLQRVEVKTPIIFTTAYDEFAIKAFKQKSVDYLLKPIDKGELRAALEKFKSMYSRDQPIDMQALSALIRASGEKYRERIKVKIGDRFRSIKLSDVTMFYSAAKITFVATESGRSYPIDQSLESMDTQLNPEQFHRVNRSHMVNIDFIAEVLAYSNSRLKVTVMGMEEEEIIVSRDRVKGFKDWLG